LLEIALAPATISTESIRRAQTMSLTAARTRPRGSRANATACTAVRKTSARTQIVGKDRGFDTSCDSKTALASSLGYGSYCRFISVAPREIAGREIDSQPPHDGLNRKLGSIGANVGYLYFLPPINRRRRSRCLPLQPPHTTCNS
jgi:hypothetical protein